MSTHGHINFWEVAKFYSYFCWNPAESEQGFQLFCLFGGGWGCTTGVCFIFDVMRFQNTYLSETRALIWHQSYLCVFVCDYVNIDSVEDCSSSAWYRRKNSYQLKERFHSRRTAVWASGSPELLCNSETGKKIKRPKGLRDGTYLQYADKSWQNSEGDWPNDELQLQCYNIQEFSSFLKMSTLTFIVKSSEYNLPWD